MKKIVLLSLCLNLLIAAAEEETMTIYSGNATYTGMILTLKDDVKVEHELGVISAEQVVFIPENINKKMRFSTVTMKDNVLLQFKEGGKLCCCTAVLDYKTLEGHFEGQKDGSQVTYHEMIKDKSGNLLPLIVKSQLMNLKIKREESNNKKSYTSFIQEIEAEKNVIVNYNQDFIALSDRATYEKIPVEGRLPGIIGLTAQGDNGLCQITNRNGDIIQASSLTINTIRKELQFRKPKGTIYASHEAGVDKVEFTSDTLDWIDSKDLMKLKGNVAIQQKGVGNLTNPNEVLFYQYNYKGKKQLRCIESLGETDILRIDENSGLTHNLQCYGKATLDHEHLQTILESPSDPNGNITPDQQVHFEDHLGILQADKVIIDYEYANSTIYPKKITLLGNVKIFNRKKSKEQDEETPLLQYALSDKVEFIPETKEMTFSSVGKHRVLFYDKANHVQVSAPTLKIKREPGMKSDSIKGVGDVRFSFIDREFEQLRKIFNLENE